MLPICNQAYISRHYQQIEVGALAVITMIFITSAVYLLQRSTPMPAAFVAGVYLSTASALAAFFLFRSILLK